MIKIIVDSACDIPPSEREEYGIEMLGVPINVDGKTYYEGHDFTNEEYYGMLSAAKSIPTHAQVTMVRFAEAFSKAVSDGYKHIVCITITSKGSGTCDAAKGAKKMLCEENPDIVDGVTIDVIDSKNYTYAYGHIAVGMAKLAKETNDLQQVLNYAYENIERYTIVAGLTNLTYARKSGRISSAAAFVGEAMGFRPILRMVNGSLESDKRVRGDSKLIAEMASRYFELSAEDGSMYYIVSADSLDNANLLLKEISSTKNTFGGIYRVGASITTNAGPTVFGIVFAEKK